MPKGLECRKLKCPDCEEWSTVRQWTQATGSLGASNAKARGEVETAEEKRDLKRYLGKWRIDRASPFDTVVCPKCGLESEKSCLVERMYR